MPSAYTTPRNGCRVSRRQTEWERDVNLPAVCVIGSPHETKLADALFECGLTPVFRETILAALATLRKERFLAVVIDQRGTKADPLEIILNIRDVDERVRVFVLAEDGKKTAPDQLPDFVSVVDQAELVRKLTPTAVPIPPGAGEEPAHLNTAEQ